MKGITHFTAGIAVGTFFTSLVQQAANFSSLDLIWGGTGGYLPDFLDFKLYKFLEKWDYQIEPDEKEKKPLKILHIIKSAIERAYKENKEIKVKLHTLQIGPDLWRRYGVAFNSKEKKIQCFIGPSVTTSQIPFPANQEPEEKAEISLDIPFEYLYDKPVIVDIFTGPSLAFKNINNKVEIEFLPWHRTWSHSLTIGFLFSLILGSSLWLLKSPNFIISSLVFFLGYVSHIFLDQIGFMGSNLFFPFTKKRTRGFKLTESVDPVTNFSTMWFLVGLILFNINRASSPPIFLAPFQFLFFFVFLPPFLLLTFYALYKKKRRERIEIEEEMEDPFKNF